MFRHALSERWNDNDFLRIRHTDTRKKCIPTAASKPYAGEFNAQGIRWGFSAVRHSRDSLQILQGWALQGFFANILCCTPGASLGQPRDFLGIRDSLGLGAAGLFGGALGLGAAGFCGML